MSKKYYIKFNTGKEVTGTAKEIVTQLRNESRLLAITPRKYARLVAKSYEMSTCLLYTSPSPRDRTRSRMPSSA